MRSLGKVQLGVLDCLADRGSYPGSGWVWSTHSETERVCESLIRRGLVVCVNCRAGYPAASHRYEITDKGMIALFGGMTDTDIRIRVKVSRKYRKEAERRGLI